MILSFNSKRVDHRTHVFFICFIGFVDMHKASPYKTGWFKAINLNNRRCEYYFD